MLKVLLISLRSPFLDSDRVFPPLGILYLKGVLDANGIHSVLEDEFDFENSEKYEEFDYFFISCMTPQRQEMERIRKVFPNKKIIIGGPHASFYTEECYKGGYDQIVIGDGEPSIQDILLKNNRSKILKNQMTAREMNNIPLPYRSDFLHRYSYFLDGLKTTTVITSRGCPFNCAFCEHARTKVRYYTLERIQQELKQITDLGFEAVMFFDDLFTVSQKRVNGLCDTIQKSDIKKFRCFGHAKLMTHKIAETLAKANCVETGVGMKTGSQDILNTVKFPTPTVQQNYEYVKTCHEFGIRVKAFFILGLPGETLETIKETEELIATSGIDDFDLVVYNPYAGTKIRDEIEKFDLFLLSEGEGYYKGASGSTEVLVSTSALSPEQIAKERDRIYNKYKKLP